MADEAKADGKTTEKAPEKPTYHRDRLIAESQGFFAQPSHVAAGALSTGRLARKVNFTRDEAERAIRDFLDRPVEHDYIPEEEA